MSIKKGIVAVIDDSRTIRIILQDHLTAEGYEVHLFEDGINVSESLLKIQPDIIVLDITMPEIDGYDVCRQIKQNPTLHGTPIIFLSSLSKPKDMVKSFEVGAVDHVSKPIIIEVLKARIKTHINLFHLQQKQRDENYALENLIAEKMEALYQAQMCTITALAKLAEHRDPETGSHLDRVAAYCELIAEDLLQQNEYGDCINKPFIQYLKYSSCLHDIGKVAIPDSILLKPGSLTESEFIIMKKHSSLGAETLDIVLKEDPNNQFILTGYEIAYYHHEKWDGSGYPIGLKNLGIPISARIMALADVYDALRSERCYKKSFSHAKSYAIIEKGNATHFDPVIVDSFIRNEEKFDKIWKQFHD